MAITFAFIAPATSLADALVGAAFLFQDIALPTLLCLAAAAYVQLASPGLPMLASAAGRLALGLALAPLGLFTSSGGVLGLLAIEGLPGP